MALPSGSQCDGCVVTGRQGGSPPPSHGTLAASVRMEAEHLVKAQARLCAHVQHPRDTGGCYHGHSADHAKQAPYTQRI